MQILMECRAVELHPNTKTAVVKLEAAEGAANVVSASVVVIVPIDSPLVQEFDDRAVEHAHQQYLVSAEPTGPTLPPTPPAPES